MEIQKISGNAQGGIVSCKWYNKIGLTLIILFCFFRPVWSQTTESSRERIEEIIERVVAELDPEDSEQRILEIIERLEELAANPVNINRAGIDELSGVPGLNLQLAQSIIQYRKSIKPFEHIEELLDVDGIGGVTLDNLLPFVTIGRSFELGKDLYLNPNYWTYNSSFENLTRYQRVVNAQEGYSRPDTLGGYLGSPVKYNHRFRYRSDRLSVNLTQDKDPGEPLSGPTGFDFTSWHAAIQNAGRLKNLIIGDFRVSYGQGLTLWNGGAFGKSSQVIGSAVKNDPGIRPYTSYQETNGFRGVAATYGEQLQVSGFYSKRKRTASDASAGRVRSPTASGLHRTLSENDRRLNLQQETFGGRIRYQFRHGIIGASGYHQQYDRKIEKGTQPYQLYGFEGDRFSVAGTDYRLTAGPAMIFGELAWSSNNSLGFITGSEVNLPSGTDLAVAYRNYEKDFQSASGSGFGEQSNPQNEEGFFTGIRQRFGEILEFNAYIDFFHTHVARFRNTRPTSGFDWLARLQFEPLDNLSFYGQLRSKTWEQQMDASDSFGRETITMGTETRSNARLHIEYQALDVLRLRTRFDVVRWSATSSPSSFGYLVYQDVRLTPTSTLTIDARITLFETDDFNSRVFQFENDLLYVMSNAMLFDQGQRTYIVIRYQPADFLVLRMKASTTLYENKQFIGSGLNMIEGSRRSDIGLQIQLKI
ncbi:ComEA family DNA-binding protein [Rhodohalobacter sp. 8-1]|uniref:ComEA family DNA-binding protein n=1 Tax=Rhodohalobacter sp. 8-1 TaxID=3131972 RepID=UPI0030EE813D